MGHLESVTNIKLSSSPDSPETSIGKMLEMGMGLPVILAATYRGALTTARLYPELETVPSLDELHAAHDGDILDIIVDLAYRAEPPSSQAMRRHATRRLELGGF